MLIANPQTGMPEPVRVNNKGRRVSFQSSSATATAGAKAAAPADKSGGTPGTGPPAAAGPADTEASAATELRPTTADVSPADQAAAIAAVEAAATPGTAVVEGLANAVKEGQPPTAPALPPTYPPPPKHPPAPPLPPAGGPVAPPGPSADTPGVPTPPVYQDADAQTGASLAPSIAGSGAVAASAAASGAATPAGVPDAAATTAGAAVTPVAPTMDAATAAAAAAMQERIEALERWRLQQLQESFARQHEAERAAEAVDAGLDPHATVHGDKNSIVIAGMRGGPGVETAVPKRRRSTGNSDGYLMALRMRGRRLEVESLTAEVMTLKSAMERRWNELQQAGGESRSSVIDMTPAAPGEVPASTVNMTQLMHETETSLQRTPFRGVHESITKVTAHAGAWGTPVLLLLTRSGWLCWCPSFAQWTSSSR